MESIGRSGDTSPEAESFRQKTGFCGLSDNKPAFIRMRGLLLSPETFSVSQAIATDRKSLKLKGSNIDGHLMVVGLLDNYRYSRIEFEWFANSIEIFDLFRRRRFPLGHALEPSKMTTTLQHFHSI